MTTHYSTSRYCKQRMVKAIALILGSSLTLSGLHAAAAEGQLQGIVGQPDALEAVALKRGALNKIEDHLVALDKEFKDFVLRRGRSAIATFRSSNGLLRVDNNGMVGVDVTANDVAAARLTMESNGCTSVSVFQRVLSAECPIESNAGVSSGAGIKFIRASMADKSAGSVNSQGDIAIRADIARSTAGVDGNGVKVGVISDSYDCSTTAITHAANDIASGDLPAGGVQVLADIAPPCIDEGRAMLQLIHDVAPGASLAFHTGFTGMAGMANGILALRNTANAQVIVDDVIQFAEPMFQDGVIAQAVDQVVASGASYFSSAGNSGRKSYEATFVPSSQREALHNSVLHDFDPGPGEDVYQAVTLPGGGARTPLSFQWDEPFASVSGPPGAASDYDIWICLSDTQPVNTTNCPVFALSNNIGGDAVEIVGPTVNGPALQVFIAISKFAGTANNKLKYVSLNSSMTINQYDTSSSTSYGHANSAGAEAVGAAFFGQTPAFGQSPPLREAFSSAGGVPILFNTSGAAIPAVIRQKPEIVSADGGNTTFFGNDILFDVDTFPNFFGTSAAAPHAAAVAALMLDSTGAPTSTPPSTVYNALETTALDMAAPGFDFDSGFGLIRADAAVALVSLPACKGDFDTDGDVDGQDLIGFNSSFGRTNCSVATPCNGDFDRDGDVDGADLTGFNADFGRTNCPTSPPSS